MSGVHERMQGIANTNTNLSQRWIAIFVVIFAKNFVLEGFAVISEETNALLLDTFDNIEEEEFFEVIYNIPNHVFWT